EPGISSDILNRSFEIVHRSQEDFLKLAPEYQAMAVAFADGINRYLATHPETTPRRLTHFEPWYALTMDRHLLLEFVYRRAHVKKPQSRSQKDIARQEGSTSPVADAFNSWDLHDPTMSPFAQDVQAAIGSNAWAIAGTKTASGSTMLFVNPHQPFYGMGQFYE